SDCVPNGSQATCKPATTFDYDDSLGFKRATREVIAPHGAWLDTDGDGNLDVIKTRVRADDKYVTERQVVGGAVVAAGMGLDMALIGLGPPLPVGGALSQLYSNFIGSELFPVDVAVTQELTRFTGERTRYRGETFRNIQGLSCSHFSPGMIGDYNADGRDDIVESCFELEDVRPFDEIPIAWRVDLQLA